MYSKILVAVDGSETSIKALSKAVELAEGWNAEVHAVYAIDPGIYGTSVVDPSVGVIDPTSERIFKMLNEEGKKVIDKCLKVSESAGYKVNYQIKIGDAKDTITDLAEELKADLIVIGSTGKGITRRLLLGSVSSYVVTHSKISTLIVRG
ncbi:universal stress protein [Methanoplanus endosymbiosus]|uniref:Universal stress protein n=1 Tax=Methanoplanus endosymbiosus TaxID=33865 RepID=A0A9E7PNQ9_9EURY|nr:universal stress protein [Methanoplanus endosymbiosus]UUX93635.1 universal stress protein [Methanoplanus endosymbiosus]